MSSLHTVSKAPQLGLLAQCLAVATAGDAVILLEDGVYYCLKNPEELPPAGDVALFALAEDLSARGLLERNRAGIELASYVEFVDLCCKHERSVSWF